MTPLTSIQSPGTGGYLEVLSQLSRMKFNVLAGTTANTNIAVSGIATDDVLMFCLRLDRDATAANITMADVTAEVAITSAGNVQLSTTNTTGDSLLLIWCDKQ
jgi:hypothetical protein